MSTIPFVVDVYRNLLRKCVSVRQGGKVVARAQTVVLVDVEFRVQPGKLARVRARHEREICAYVRGTVRRLDDEPIGQLPTDAQRVCFNPFQHDAFVLEDGRAVVGAEAFFMTTPCGSWVVNPTLAE